MKTIFETCQPRDEVLRGELKDEIFRASLTDVHNQQAEDVYKDPKTFFDHTHRTDGLKTLLKEALGRLTGVKAANSPVIRLETSFGGGKTHNLIALYHLASGKVSHKMVSDLVPLELIPPKSVRAIPLVGS
ncbi:MAG: AAA family ATPase, partial [Proteobacteria bacterium]|nr:AAA family ATPase [Pseudomonadota bacterium]